MPDSPRFIADAMLGSLSKWLRILGFDPIYFRIIDDNELIRIAGQQQRIILTRDTGIVKSKKCDNCILITSNDTFEQLKEVLALLRTKDLAVRVSEMQRCTACNGVLVPSDRSSVADDVPEHVFLNCSAFFICRDCGKVYWEGAHRKMIESKIGKVFKELGINWKNSEKN